MASWNQSIKNQKQNPKKIEIKTKFTGITKNQKNPNRKEVNKYDA